MTTDDPRTRGLGTPARPARATTIAPPAPPAPVKAPEPAPPAPVDPAPAAIPAAVVEPTPPTTKARRKPQTGRRADPVLEPRVGSRRGRAVQVSTSLPFAVSTAVDERSAVDAVTLGSIVTDAWRAHGAEVAANPPRPPKRVGGTTTRQFLVSAAEADELADLMATIVPGDRLAGNVSLFLRHCLERYLA